MNKTQETPEAFKHLHKGMMARTLQILLVASWAIILILIGAIVLMLPLKKTETIFVEFTSSKDTFFRTVPLNQMNRSQEEFLIRGMLRNYVINRETRDTEAAMIERMRPVKEMSSPQIFEKIKKDYLATREVMKDFNRQIYIVSDSPISKGIHQIEYRTVDTQGEYEVKNLWIATIHYTYDIREINEDQALINPLNLKVTKFNIAKREVSQSELDAPLKAFTPFEELNDE